MCEIRQVTDTGFGSGRVTFPERTPPQDVGLVGDDDGSIDGHLAFEQDEEGSVSVEPIQ